MSRAATARPARPARPASPRIDKLPALAKVLLDFCDGRGEDEAVFVGVVGEGDDRRARFLSTDSEGGAYEWEAYRYGGRWAWGTSADRLRVLEVIA